MLQSILSNIAIILLMHLLMSILLSLRGKLSKRTTFIAMIFVVAGAVISMYYLPIEFEGYILDMRWIPLVFLAYFWGSKYAIPALLISSLWRYIMGGDGALPGIVFGMVGPTLLALAFHRRSRLQGKYVEKVLLVTTCWLVCDVPIIFFMPNGLEIFNNIALIRGLSFVITAIILYICIIIERQRSSANERLQKLVGEDPLTKLINKTTFFEVIEEKLKKLEPKHYIAMMDIDHFKELNDTYGHVIGDQVLMGVGRVLRKFEHEELKIARYGGEEFILYLGNSSSESATQILEEIRKDIKNIHFMLEHGKSIHITISIGLAEIEKNCQVLQTVHKADKNLYLAKANGRNRVVTPKDVPFLKSS